MEEPSTLSVMVLFWLTGLSGGVIVLFVFVFLKRKNTSITHLTTYTNRHTEVEDGPVLELPPGVSLPRKQHQ